MPPKTQLTHFLCVPLASDASRPQLRQAFQQFRSRISEASGGQLDPDKLGRAIRPLSTIHLTLGVMSLDSEEKIEGACSILKELDTKKMLQEAATAAQTTSGKLMTTGPPQPQQHMAVTLVSLANFKRSAKTSVLYAEPLDTTARLLPFCNALRQKFVDAGYVIDEGRDLTLHATVLNTLYAQSPQKGRHGRGRPMQFDPASLIEEFRDFVWMEEVRLDRVAVCKMGAEKVKDDAGTIIDERYHEVAAVNLPD